jgi:O-antigen biosynthesis protein
MAGLEAEVFVVDNASQDGSHAYLNEKFNWVLFDWNHENKGFAKACNQALQKAKGKYILFLNPDTIVPEDCFEKCIGFFEKTSNAGAIGIRMLDGKGIFLPESKRSFPSPVTSLYKLVGLSSLFPRSKVFSKYHLGNLPQNQNHEIDVIAGAFMMIQKEVLDITGGFDETFFMYGEDVDLSYRVKQVPLPGGAGNYKNYYFSESFILHYKGESTKKGSLNYVRMFYVAMSKFVQKHYSSSRAGLYTGFINIAIWLRAMLSVLKRFIQIIGLPVLDALLIYVMFWLAQTFWIGFVKTEIVYEKQLLTISFVGFSFLFLIVSYYTGLYEKKYRYKNLWRSFAVTIILNLAVYSLLPERFRFSRGIVLAGSFFSFAVLAVWRWLLLKTGFLEKDDSDEETYSVIAGTVESTEEVKKLLTPSGKASNIRGFVSPQPQPHSLGTIDQLPQILQHTPVKELILCESNALSFKEILAVFEQSGLQAKLRLHAAGSKSIVGSDSKNYAGEVIGESHVKLALPVNRRIKRLTDVCTSLFLLLTFPAHFILNRHPVHVITHCLEVLLNRKTWVGFTGPAGSLPYLKPSVLGPAGIPHSKNAMNAEGLQLTNEWYAQEYEAIYDLVTVFTHYQNLGIK